MIENIRDLAMWYTIYYRHCGWGGCCCYHTRDLDTSLSHLARMGHTIRGVARGWISHDGPNVC